MFRCRLSQKGLKGWGLLLLSMESIAEVVIVSEKKVCTSCKVLKHQAFFIKCRCAPGAFFKTCLSCRDSNKKYRDKIRDSKVIVVDDVVSVSSSSSTTPADFFDPAPPPSGLGLIRRQTGLGSVSFD